MQTLEMERRGKRVGVMMGGVEEKGTLENGKRSEWEREGNKCESCRA